MRLAAALLLLAVALGGCAGGPGDGADNLTGAGQHAQAAKVFAAKEGPDFSLVAVDGWDPTQGARDGRSETWSFGFVGTIDPTAACQVPHLVLTLDDESALSASRRECFNATDLGRNVPYRAIRDGWISSENAMQALAKDEPERHKTLAATPPSPFYRLRACHAPDGEAPPTVWLFGASGGSDDGHMVQRSAVDGAAAPDDLWPNCMGPMWEGARMPDVTLTTASPTAKWEFELTDFRHTILDVAIEDANLPRGTELRASLNSSKKHVVSFTVKNDQDVSCAAGVCTDTAWSFVEWEAGSFQRSGSWCAPPNKKCLDGVQMPSTRFELTVTMVGPGVTPIHAWFCADGQGEDPPPGHLCESKHFLSTWRG